VFELVDQQAAPPGESSRKKSTRAIASHRQASNARTARARASDATASGSGRHQQLRVVVLVLVGVRVELVAGHDLARQPTPRVGRRPAHRLRSRTDESPLDQAVLVVVEGERDGGVELADRALAHADDEPMLTA